ncbi:MAG: response regulator [Erysipelotrichaceae bacterium]
MKIAVVDDEPYFCEIVTNLIGNNYPVTAFYDGKSFLEKVDQFDLVILDINIPNMSGLEISKSIQNKNITIIFLTSLAEKVYNAFGKNVRRFILKENIHTLPVILSEVIAEIQNENILNVGVEINEIVIDFDKIIYIDYNNRQLNIHTINKMIQIHNYTFDEMMNKIDNRFIKIYRSISINLDHILLIQHRLVTMDNKDKLPVSRNKIKALHTAYTRRVLND